MALREEQNGFTYRAAKALAKSSSLTFIAEEQIDVREELLELAIPEEVNHEGGTQVHGEHL